MGGGRKVPNKCHLKVPRHGTYREKKNHPDFFCLDTSELPFSCSLNVRVFSAVKTFPVAAVCCFITSRNFDAKYFLLPGISSCFTIVGRVDWRLEVSLERLILNSLMQISGTAI
jgi:hypothetical protein